MNFCIEHAQSNLKLSLHGLRNCDKNCCCFFFFFKFIYWKHFRVLVYFQTSHTMKDKGQNKFETTQNLRLHFNYLFTNLSF